MILALGLVLALPLQAAETAWNDVRIQLYGDRVLHDGSDVIALDAPYRTDDDARTRIAATIRPPRGLSLGKVTLVIDENPMPVSAVFDLERPLPGFFFDVTMRINGPTPLHVVAETTDGQLWVTEGFVKTSGQGACAAPPGTDPELALATLGDMEVELSGGLPAFGEALSQLTARTRRMDVDISHPSHSGMQMDQITLLFLPMRYVETVDIALDGAGYVEMTGSISLSENPRIGLSVPSSAQHVNVTMTDTDGTRTHAYKQLTGF